VRDVAWRDLVGRRVLAFGDGPTPRLCLEYLLERHGVNPATVEMVTDLPGSPLVERFLDDQFDFLLGAQPVTEDLVLRGRAYIAAALGPALGPFAVSAYLATPRLVAERADSVRGWVRALYRAQRWLHGHPAEEVAEHLGWAFPAVPSRVLVGAVRRYGQARTWATDPVLRRPDFDTLQEILLLRGFVRRSQRYEDLVNVEHAVAAKAAVDAE
jgi:NitT/TauT family transport system substrate-binding protein